MRDAAPTTRPSRRSRAWPGSASSRATLATLGSRLGIAGLLALDRGDVLSRRARIARWTDRGPTLGAHSACAVALRWPRRGRLAARPRRRESVRVGRLPLQAARGVRRLGDEGDEVPRDSHSRRGGSGSVRLVGVRATPSRVSAAPALAPRPSSAATRRLLVELRSFSAASRSGSPGLQRCVGLLRDRVRASILLPFVAALATAPAFFGQLATGYANVPLAMFVAAGVVAAARWLLDDARALLILTTLFVAAACLTKNEGLLFGAATLVALVIAAEGRRRAVLVSALSWACTRPGVHTSRSTTSERRTTTSPRPSTCRGWFVGSIGYPRLWTACSRELPRSTSSGSCSCSASPRSSSRLASGRVGSAFSAAPSGSCRSRDSPGSTSSRRTTCRSSSRRTEIASSSLSSSG